MTCTMNTGLSGSCGWLLFAFGFSTPVLHILPLGRALHFFTLMTSKLTDMFVEMTFLFSRFVRHVPTKRPIVFSYGDISFNSLGESKGRVSIETDRDSADSSDIEEGDTSKVRKRVVSKHCCSSIETLINYPYLRF